MQLLNHFQHPSATMKRPKEYLLNHETAFNIHNPSLDHRDR